MAGIANIIGGAAAAISFLNQGGNNRAAGNLSKFYSTIHGKKGTLARTNRFMVMIGLPRIARGYNSTEFLSFMCEGVTLPGVAFQTTDVKSAGYGPSEKRPHNVHFGDITMNFLADAEGEVQKFFYRWMNGIVRWDKRPSQVEDSFEVEYRADYVVPVQIITYSENDDRLITYRLNEAYPTSMGDTPLSWGDTDNIVKLPIQWTFLNWEIENVDSSSIFAAGKSSQLSLLQTLVKTGTIVQTLSTLRKPQSVGDAINVVNNARIIVPNINF